jgi:chromosome partitioning protein
MGCDKLAVIMQKGGVGKTTTTTNLAAAAARAGKRVLLVDVDPQGNAGTALGLVPRQLDKTLYEVLWGTVPASDAIVNTAAGVDVLPSNNNLWALASEMPKASRQVPAFLDPDLLLRTRLGGLEARYDVVLIDTPPSLDFLTRAALAWATRAIVTLQTEFFSLDGAIDLLDTLKAVRSPGGLNPLLQVAGVVATMHQARTNLGIQVLEEAKVLFRQHGISFFGTVVPRTIRFGESPAIGVPAILATDEEAVSAYWDLAEEVFGVVIAEGTRKAGIA